MAVILCGATVPVLLQLPVSESVIGKGDVVVDRPYVVLGPFEVKHGGDRFVDNGDFRDFWNEPESRRRGVSTAHGVYVFAMRASKGYTPWYVGKATGRRGFAQEVFAPGKLHHYNRVLRNYRRGTPVVFLVVPVTPATNRIRRAPAREVEWVERHLITVAVEANPKLRNSHGTALQREIQIPGVLNAGAKGKELYPFLRTMNRWKAPSPAPVGVPEAPDEPSVEVAVEAAPEPPEFDPDQDENIANVPEDDVSPLMRFLFGESIAQWLAR
jgi:hypothetical protein